MKPVRYSVVKVLPDPPEPAVPVVLPGELAEWGGYESDDPLLAPLIQTATEWCEAWTGMSFITAQFREFLDYPPGSREQWWDGVRDGAITQLFGCPSVIELHRAPLVGVDSVSFFDDADQDTVAPDTSYYVDTASRTPRVALRSGFSWPSVVLRVANAVEVLYSAGFGATAQDVPQTIKDAIKTLAAYLYEHRGMCDMDDALAMSGAAAMLSQYRRARL